MACGLRTAAGLKERKCNLKTHKVSHENEKKKKLEHFIRGILDNLFLSRCSKCLPDVLASALTASHGGGQGTGTI